MDRTLWSTVIPDDSMWSDSGATTDNKSRHQIPHMTGLIEIPALRYSLVVLYVCAILLAAAGNGIIVYFIIKYRRAGRRRRSNVTGCLVLNLALCDFINAVFHEPLNLVDIVLPFSYKGQPLPPITKQYCQATGFFSSFFACVGFHTVVAISAERFLLICHPFKAKEYLTVGRIKAVIILIWVTSFAAVLPLVTLFTFVATVNYENTNVTFCHFDIRGAESEHGWRYFIFLFSTYYLLPLIVITVLYGKIFYTLHKKLCCTAVKDEALRRMLHTRKSIAKLMMSIAAIFALSHGPYFITCLYISLGGQIHNNNVLILCLVHFIPLCGSACNPVIYSTHSRTFRHGMSFYSTQGDAYGSNTNSIRVPQSPGASSETVRLKSFKVLLRGYSTPTDCRL